MRAYDHCGSIIWTYFTHLRFIPSDDAGDSTMMLIKAPVALLGRLNKLISSYRYSGGIPPCICKSLSSFAYRSAISVSDVIYDHLYFACSYWQKYWKARQPFSTKLENTICNSLGWSSMKFLINWNLSE